jgi:hypothetical protein
MPQKQNGVAMLLAAFNPVPAAVNMAEQLHRMEKLDPKIQEARSLAEDHFSRVDESTREEYVGPLLWTWTCLPPPLLVPPPSGWPNSWPWPPGWPPVWPPIYPNWWIGPIPISDGNLVLQGTEMLLDGALSHDSIEALGNETARWSRSSNRNADRLSAAQEEFRYFLDEYSKLEVERKHPVVIGLGVLALILGGGYLGFASMPR